MNLHSWHLYLRGDMVYLPTVARTTVGYFMDIDPVKVVSASETEALQRAITEIIIKGNPLVPAPPRANFPKAVVLKYAKVKSWSAFEKEAQNWSIVEKLGNYQIKPGRRRPDKGWEDDPERIESLPPGTKLDTVVQRIADLVQVAARSGLEK